MVHSFIRLPCFVHSFLPSFSSRFLIGISYRKRKLIEEFNQNLGSTSVREVSKMWVVRPTITLTRRGNFILTLTRSLFDPTTRVIVPFLTRDARETFAFPDARLSKMLHYLPDFSSRLLPPPSSLSLFLMTTSRAPLVTKKRLNHAE